ncbi:MAG: chorismate mutase [Oscillospiraceae bacterium]|jgi:chorismate mutase/prephenate dehydratase
MPELDTLRNGIDQIDRMMLDLLEKRLTLTAQVAEYKQKKGLPVLDAEREKQVLASKQKLVRRSEQREAVSAFFEAIMAISRRQQGSILAAARRPEPMSADVRLPVEDPRVLFQGESGAYGEEAAIGFFGEKTKMDHATSFEDVFLALLEDRADYGVLPMENNSTGSITAVYDLFSRYGCYIVGEQIVPVRHCLMAPSGATLLTVKKVYSHEQGFFQSKSFLKQQEGWTLHPLQNTAAAAKFVAESGDVTKAAVGSLRAARLYGLTVLQEDIHDEAGNGTRFVILSKEPEQRAGSDKMSALFKIPHESGSLYRVLSVLSAHGLNLLKLESRPIAGRDWEYLFFLDFSGNWDEANVQAAMEELSRVAVLQVLGNYKGAARRGGEGGAL